MKSGEAIKHFSEMLKKDKEMRQVIEANLAMAFIDNYHWYKKRTGKSSMSNKDIHSIGNQGAEYFLKLICDEFKVPEGR